MHFFICFCEIKRIFLLLLLFCHSCEFSDSFCSNFRFPIRERFEKQNLHFYKMINLFFMYRCQLVMCVFYIWEDVLLHLSEYFCITITTEEICTKRNCSVVTSLLTEHSVKGRTVTAEQFPDYHIIFFILMPQTYRKVSEKSILFLIP